MVYTIGKLVPLRQRLSVFLVPRFVEEAAAEAKADGWN